nr:retrovirus-related Pol polyprotein from transposon TNT 1-94 [Tanacetum cinerariifolium]
MKREVEEIETLNIELDHKVTKLVAENEHLKQTYKHLYDSIKSLRVRSKEQCDDLINKVNLKSAEVSDLNAILKLRRNRTAHTDYIRHIHEEAATLKEIIESERLLSLLNTSLDYALKRKVWKPTGNVFKIVGHIWKPIGRTFTLVGNVCPLTRIDTPTIVPPREPIPIANSTDKPVVTLVYSRKTKAANKKVLNKMEPNNSWGSSSSNVPSLLIACRNDHMSKIMGYEDYQIGNMTISWVYYVEGLRHNLFSVGQFCDSDLEVVFRQHTCFIRNLDGVDLGKGSKDTVILKLKEKLRSLNGDVNERNVKRKVEEIETLNIELDHKVDVAPLVPKLRKNRTAHTDYIRHTQEETATLREIVESCPNRPLIMGYGNYQIGNVTISWVYYVEGLWHNLFSVGQFCDSDLEVAFRQHTCFICNLDGVDLLTFSRRNNLYTLSLQDIMASSPICVLSKASKTKSWLWHHLLSHLNFGAINRLARQGLVRGLLKLKFEKDHLCSACAMGKSTKKTYKPKSEDTNQKKLYLLYMDLCGPMRVESVNGKKYILIIIDDYSRFTWVKFLRSKDETLDFIIKFLKMIQRLWKPPVLLKIVPLFAFDMERLPMSFCTSSSGPALNEMTPGTISSEIVLKSSPLTSYVSPSRNDWDLLFQSMFD